ncbi:MAG TPA: hypothetical protein VFK04_06380 [Gemmatimonadaceae bacterium]|nr:hypothetical protein [Gemmatimonadaceae bacterium]
MKSGRSVSLVLLAVLLTACGGDEATAPQLTPEMMARQLDSLGVAVATAGGQDRSLALVNAAQSLRSGAEPSVITIAEDGVADDYQALVTWFRADTFTVVGTDPARKLVIPDHWTLVAWKGAPASGRLIAVTALTDSVSLGMAQPAYGDDGTGIPVVPAFGLAMVIENGALRLLATSGTAGLMAGDAGQKCAAASTLISSRRDPLISRSDLSFPIECSLTSFDVGFDAVLAPPSDSFSFLPDTTAPSHTLTMPSQVVQGIRFEHGT